MLYFSYHPNVPDICLNIFFITGYYDSVTVMKTVNEKLLSQYRTNELLDPSVLFKR